jgi:hypothetical protein
VGAPRGQQGHRQDRRRPLAHRGESIEVEPRTLVATSNVIGLALRFLRCPECRRLVAICERCDSGRVTCSDACARVRRRRHRREAGRRYQATPRGADKHAERQRRYRARVTHAPDAVPDEPPRQLPAAASTSITPDLGRCARCETASSGFFRPSPSYSALRNWRPGRRGRHLRRRDSQGGGGHETDSRLRPDAFPRPHKVPLSLSRDEAVPERLQGTPMPNGAPGAPRREREAGLFPPGAGSEGRRDGLKGASEGVFGTSSRAPSPSGGRPSTRSPSRTSEPPYLLPTPRCRLLPRRDVLPARASPRPRRTGSVLLAPSSDCRPPSRTAPGWARAA